MRRRNILVIAVLLTVAAVSIFYFMRRQAAIPVVEVPEMFMLAPPDATSLFYVDLAALRRSPFLAQLFALAPSPGEDPDYRDFVAATGFDYSRELDRALVATLPPSSPASTIAFADGRFDREKIAAYSMRSGKLGKRNGSEVYVISTGKPPRIVSFAFLAPERIVLANSAVLDPSALRPVHALPLDQLERVRRVGGSAIIVLARVDASQENFSVFGYRSRDLKRILRDVRWLSLGARPDGELLKVALEAECINAEAARELARAAETLRLLARLLLSDARARRQLSPQAAALGEVILRNSEFIQNDQRVQMRFEITADALAAPALPESERPAPARPR